MPKRPAPYSVHREQPDRSIVNVSIGIVNTRIGVVNTWIGRRERAISTAIEGREIAE
jgi:hypothetical protein